MSNRAIGPHIDGLTFREHLGSGGYSDVYLYERRKPRMPVAVKVLVATRMSEADLRQFSAEAEAMAELADHPYIVQVFSTGTTADGRPYLVMKYYPPPNLALRAADGRMPVAEVLRTGIKIASAVETAHRVGILHRDIKPANILMSAYGQPGLADFGVAGRRAGADSDAEGDVGVSIPWAAPEVLSGASNGSITSDLYSLAASLWQLLSGRSPYEALSGDNSPRAMQTRALTMAAPTTGRVDVPASLERLLQQTMSRNPSHRPSSVLEFALALQTIEHELRYARTEIMVEGWTGGRPDVPDRDGAGSSARTPAASGASRSSATVSRSASRRRGSADGDPPRRSRARWRLGAAVVLLVGAALAVIMSSGDLAKRRHPDLGPSGPSGGDQLGFAGTTAQAPTIIATYDAEAALLTFTWTAAPVEGRAPQFVYLLGGNEVGPTDATSATIAAADPVHTCITVGTVDPKTGARANKRECGQ